MTVPVVISAAPTVDCHVSAAEPVAVAADVWLAVVVPDLSAVDAGSRSTAMSACSSGAVQW